LKRAFSQDKKTIPQAVLGVYEVKFSLSHCQVWLSYTLTVKATFTTEHELPPASSTNHLKPDILLTGQSVHICPDINKNHAKHYK